MKDEERVVPHITLLQRTHHLPHLRVEVVGHRVGEAALLVADEAEALQYGRWHLHTRVSQVRRASQVRRKLKRCNARSRPSKARLEEM
jgi:hypothetical protein